MSVIQLQGHATELPGGMTVRRLLPAAAARAVGPFVFFDHFGPVTLPASLDSDVGPHPHIGLATVTYLFDGAMQHRDSLGTSQLIEPGDINWMHAGSGIVHSERTPGSLRGQPRSLHGLQLWVALPPGQTDTAPHFQHVPASLLPMADYQGARLRVIVGEVLGLCSPVAIAWPTVYADIELPAGREIELPALAAQWALYAPEHPVWIDDAMQPARQMAVLGPESIRLRAGNEVTRVVLIGGEPLPQAPRMWWNFVAYERATLGRAAARWVAGEFPAIPGEPDRVADRVAAPPWRD